MKFRHVLIAVVVVAMAVALTGCGGSSSSTTTPPATAPSTSTGTAPSTAPAAGGATVTEQGFAFNPATLTVKVGDTVTFTNADSAPHNVKIDGAELGAQNNGESKTWKATKAGSFPYVCTIHPSMTGQITVQ